MNTIALEVGHAVGPGVRAIVVEGVDPLREPARLPDPGRRARRPAGSRRSRSSATSCSAGACPAARRCTRCRPGSRPPTSPSATWRARSPTTAQPTQDPVSDSFHADPMVRADLLEAGFDALSLANNHTGDYGDQALVQTVQRLRAAGLETFGAGRDLAAARRPVVLERNGVTLRVPRVQRDRGDARGGARAAGRGVDQHAAADRPAGPGRAGAVPRRRTTSAIAGSTSSTVVPHWGDAVHLPSRGRSRARSLAGWWRPGPTWSSAVTRTGCRARPWSATPWS